ncbi:thiolase family protein [Spectribacter hydrogenoxidans]|uniref:Thiolase family protein n=1 Tax=Spectribacter hydrogenoxidans TaxID=3075608 RepID=A0ABU3BZ35_9GAMM|nr:thiolase family protein [Salinisphaera sp. W335]MDT0634568.1 thiolase family protein [Salinisphaera sp. W335]
MKQHAYIAGVGMTRFGKHPDRDLKSLAAEAVQAALADAGPAVGAPEIAYVGTAGAGAITGQTCVPGQVVLRAMGLGGIPVVNVENACATGATAFHQAASMVTLGAYDAVLVLGMDKLHHPDRQRTLDLLTGAIDVADREAVMADVAASIRAAGLTPDTADAGRTRSLFMDIYVAWAAAHMQAHGTTRAQFAAVSAKNATHGSLNPRAQYRDRLSVDEVLAAREVAWPLTLPMCSPIGDGAAALVLVSARRMRQMHERNRPVRVLASCLSGGGAPGRPPLAVTTAAAAYDAAGIGPDDLSCAEIHDASAPSEVLLYEQLGFCSAGAGGDFVEAGHSALGGRLPVNTSGGLLRKGHPIGATGCAQIVELTEQLRGETGARQVEGARLALAENGGGYLDDDSAAMVVSVLAREARAA